MFTVRIAGVASHMKAARPLFVCRLGFFAYSLGKGELV